MKPDVRYCVKKFITQNKYRKASIVKQDESINVKDLNEFDLK